jgi:replication factor A1
MEELIQKIAQQTGLSRAEIKKKIEEKKAELGFFVNDIAAAHIIAKDLNVTLKRPDLEKKSKITVKNLKKMEPGLSGVSLTGIVMRVYQPKEFVKEGSKGILAPILLHDGTDSIRTVFWGMLARKIAEKHIGRGAVIKIKRAYTKMGRKGDLELHLGDRGSLEIDTEADTEELPNPEDEILPIDNLDEEIIEVDIKGIVHKIGNLTTFNRADGTEGRVTNLFLKGERSIQRMVFWDDHAEDAFNFTRGDELLIQAANVKMDREGKPEIHTSWATYITKIGHKSLPSLNDTKETTYSQHEVIQKKFTDIVPDDFLVTVTARKGPVSESSHFKRKDGSSGSVKRAAIFDETGEMTIVLWNDSIPLFDDLEDEPFRISKLRVNLSRYKTIELHTIAETEFIPLETSQIPEDPPIQNITEINPHQGITCVQGVIQNVSEVNEFNRSNGSIGRVVSMSIQDTTGTCRIVAWDKNVEKLASIREKELKFVKVFFGRIRQTDDDSIEIHLSPQSHVRTSSRIPVALRSIPMTKTEETIRKPTLDYHKIQLSDLSDDEDGSTVEVFGKVIRLFQQTPYYWACPECRKKVIETETGMDWVCQTHNVIEPKFTMRLSGLIDDGTGTINTTFFGRSGEKLAGMSGNDIQKMIENNLTDDEIFSVVQKEVEGKTLLVQGRVQLQTREVQGETMQSQTLFVNRVIYPSPKTLAEELISDLQELQ